MNIENIRVGDLLVANEPTSNPEHNAASGIQVIEINEQGFRVRRMHINYNGETFFLTHQALTQSHWILAPTNTQLRFL